MYSLVQCIKHKVSVVLTERMLFCFYSGPLRNFARIHRRCWPHHSVPCLPVFTNGGIANKHCKLINIYNVLDVLLKRKTAWPSRATYVVCILASIVMRRCSRIKWRKLIKTWQRRAAFVINSLISKTVCYIFFYSLNRYCSCWFCVYLIFARVVDENCYDAVSEVSWRHVCRAVMEILRVVQSLFIVRQISDADDERLKFLLFYCNIF